MTQQEQFEADYLAAFPSETDMEFAKKIRSTGGYYYSPTWKAFVVWLQQRKRHEEQIAELVKSLKELGASINGDYYRGQDWERACISGLIAKYEVKS